MIAHARGSSYLMSCFRSEVFAFLYFILFCFSLFYLFCLVSEKIEPNCCERIYLIWIWM